MIPARGHPRSAYIGALRKERLNQAGRLLVDVIDELFDTHDNATTTDERTKVERAIAEVIGRIASADRAAEAAAIVEMRELAQARQGQANELDKLH